MSQARNELQTVIATLGELHAVLERLRGEFVHGIKTDEILAYQRHFEQFRESNAAFEATCTPVQLIKDLMETLGLTGSDLPEIGDKTAVSKVLGGDRPISHKMAYALAERFSMEPRAFVSAASGKAAPLETVRTKAKKTPAYYRLRNSSWNLRPEQSPDTGESKRVASKNRRHLGKAPTK